MCKILSRIQEISVKEGITIGALERQIGASKGVLSRAIAKGTDVQAKWIEAFVENYPQYSTEWLLTGKGDMLKGDHKELVATYAPVSITAEPMLEIADIPLYNVEASAGLQRLFVDGGDLLGKISIPNAPRCDGAVHVIGDSMYPLLKSGDIIAYKVLNSIESIVYGEIYLLQLCNDGDVSVVVKYVKRSEMGDDYIKLVSHNPQHDPQDVPISWLQHIARVKLTIRKYSIV